MHLAASSRSCRSLSTVSAFGGEAAGLTVSGLLGVTSFGVVSFTVDSSTSACLVIVCGVSEDLFSGILLSLDLLVLTGLEVSTGLKDNIIAVRLELISYSNKATKMDRTALNKVIKFLAIVSFDRI